MQKLAGREKELQVKKNADVVYKHVEGEVERGLEYLQVLPLDIVDRVWFVILYTFGKFWHLIYYGAIYQTSYTYFTIVGPVLVCYYLSLIPFGYL